MSERHWLRPVLAAAALALLGAAMAGCGRPGPGEPGGARHARDPGRPRPATLLQDGRNARRSTTGVSRGLKDW